MTVDRPSPWYADLPELDDRGRRAVLEAILDVLVYRNVTRDDVREAYRTAYRIATDPAAVLAEQAQWLAPDPSQGRTDPDSPDPWRWPDGPARRRLLGHQDEPTVPGYCTCGELTSRCPVRPRKWRSQWPPENG